MCVHPHARHTGTHIPHTFHTKRKNSKENINIVLFKNRWSVNLFMNIICSSISDKIKLVTYKNHDKFYMMLTEFSNCMCFYLGLIIALQLSTISFFLRIVYEGDLFHKSARHCLLHLTEIFCYNSYRIELRVKNKTLAP